MVNMEVQRTVLNHIRTMTVNNETWTKLLEQKADILTKIAVSGQDNAGLRLMTEWLGRELDMEAKYKGLISEAEQLIAEHSSPKSGSSLMHREAKSSNQLADEKWTLSELGKAERAQLARRAFFARQKEKGKTYTKVGRIYFRNEEGVVVGITFSSDEGSGSWFLNLTRGKFQEAVLLCQTGPRTVRALNLPKIIIAKYADQMSQDHKGMIKFNIRRQGNKYLLDIPQPIGPLDVTSHFDADELVCHRVLSVFD